MVTPRYFLLTGGSSVEELLDRASARGEVRAARVDRSPLSTRVVYGAVEIEQPRRRRQARR